MKLNHQTVATHKLNVIVALIALCALMGLVPRASAQNVVYSQNFDADDTANWAVNATGGYSPADFFFNYSTVGIPSAPNSTGGTTRGMKLQANLDTNVAVFPVGVSVSPNGFSITENFEMHWDMWINYNGPLNGGGNGSTQVGGAGFGTAGTSSQVAGIADCIYIGATGDGGSTADFRVYSPAFATSLQDTSGVYTAGNFVGSRNNSANYYVTNFPAVSAPAGQLALFPQQTGSTAAGAVGFKWRDVSLKKVANIITYRIDGVLIATIDASTNGTLAGANIVFNHYDINMTPSTDINRTNLAFSLIDNVRITNFPNIVSVSAGVPDVNEGAGTPANFVISRTSPGPPVTVNYTMSGTASNGVDYNALSGSVTFNATDTSTNVSFTPVNDSISEPTETVTLSITESTNYVGAGNATINILDNDAQMLDISIVSTNFYERSPFDYAVFRITRFGDLNFGSAVVVDYTNIVASGLGGGAVSNVDFSLANLPITFNPGDLTKDVNLVMPINDAQQEGTETVVLGLAPSADVTAPFAVTTNRATANLIDDEYITPERVLFSDSLNGDSSASWKVAFAANNGIDDQLVSWGFTLANDSVSNAPNGSATALKVTVNKFEASADGAAGINLYPLSKTFSNNFALRFNMYQKISQGATTEYALLGINHSSSKTNWLMQNGVGSVTNTDADGYWFAVSADGSGSAPGDYCLFRGNGPLAPPFLVASAAAGTFNQAFKSPPFFAPGAVGNDANTLTPTWVDVEIRKVNNTVTLRINNTVVISQGNATNFTSGDVMLGFDDPYMSIGTDGAVYFSNVRVVDLTPAITSVVNTGSAIQIDFNTRDLFDTGSSFAVYASPSVTGPYTDAGATITTLSSGFFRATVPLSGAAQFYRVRHQ